MVMIGVLHLYVSAYINIKILYYLMITFLSEFLLHENTAQRFTY